MYSFLYFYNCLFGYNYKTPFKCDFKKQEAKGKKFSSVLAFEAVFRKMFSVEKRLLTVVVYLSLVVVA